MTAATLTWSPPSWSNEDRLLSKSKPSQLSWLEATTVKGPWQPPVFEKRSLKRALTSHPAPAFTFSLPRAPIRAPTVPAKVQDEEIWSSAVDDAVSEGNASLELSRRSLKTVSPVVRDLRLMTKLTGDDAAPALAEVKLYLGNNFLTTCSISNCLFMVHNLVVLSLRENQLEELPYGIGRLAGLRELNVGGNRLRQLPAELNQLTLDVLNLTPNPWLPVPAEAPAEAQSYLLPLVTLHAVPSLVELCNRRLLQPCEPPSPPLGSSISGAFSRTSSAASVSGADAYGGGPCRVVHTYKGDVSDLPAHLSMPFKEVTVVPESGPSGFDPLAHLCAAGQCPVHADAPHEAVFTTPCETRIQFTRRIAGVELAMLVPIQWRGCLPGCLAFLEPEKVKAEA